MDFELSSGIAILERTPSTVRALLAGLGPEWADATEGPETWSPYDIIGHLNHGERTDWIPRARVILEQGATRRFEPYDRFAQFRESQGKSLALLLDEFTQLRAENLATLAEWRLTDSQLELEGEHPEFGAVTLRQLLATWVAHDLGHIAQIARVMARQYREAIGPWRAYLSIMRTTVVVLAALLALPKRTSAQELSYFRSLSVPPPTVGTCIPVRTKRGEHDSVTVRGSRLVMKARDPGRERDIQVLLDSTGRPRVFADLLNVSTSMLSSDGGNVTAFIDAKGGVHGMRLHMTMQMPGEYVGHFDSASMRAMRQHIKSQTTRDTLDAAAKASVTTLVAWLRKRCPA